MVFFSRLFLADTSEGRTELERALYLMGSLHLGKIESELKSVPPAMDSSQLSCTGEFLDSVRTCLPMKPHIVPGNVNAVIYQTATYLWYLLTAPAFNGKEVTVKNLENIVSDKIFPNKSRAAYVFGLKALNYICEKGGFKNVSDPMYDRLVFTPKWGYFQNYIAYLNHPFPETSLLFKKAIYVALTTGMVCPIVEKWADPNMIHKEFGDIRLTEQESAELFGIRYEVTMMELLRLEDDEIKIIEEASRYIRTVLRNF